MLSSQSSSNSPLNSSAHSDRHPVVRPRIWTIAASDSCAGAGMQADLVTARALGVDSAHIITAVTAQSSVGVDHVTVMDKETLDQQWSALKKDGVPSVLKLGWLPPNSVIRDWLIGRLSSFKESTNSNITIVWDPVKSATASTGLPTISGDFWQPLLALVDVITPNHKELIWLTESAFSGDQGHANDRQRCQWLHQQGIQTVIITGTDQQQNEKWVGSRVSHQPRVECPEEAVLPEFCLWQPRVAIAAHGSGCHFSAALAGWLASGSRLYDAILHSCLFARQSVVEASQRSSGYHQSWASYSPISDPTQWPLISDWDGQPEQLSQQPNCGQCQSLGLYVLTDNLDDLRSLLSLGVDTIQWRVKSRDEDFVETTKQALAMCRAESVSFWLNDYWQLALELQTDGVHLGQEDCSGADLNQLRQAGIALGISTHTDWEVARARTLKPAYLAFGPVHPPLSKQLKYPPLGYQRLSFYTQTNSDYPSTCIGGITSDNIEKVAASGIASVAIVTALQPGESQRSEHQALRRYYPG